MSRPRASSTCPCRRCCSPAPMRSSSNTLLLLQPAPPGVHDTAELSEDPVACRVDDPTAVVSNHREDNGLVLFEITNGGSLVSAHERAIAGDVGSEDRCQFTGNPWISRNIGHRTATGSNTCG